MTSLANLQASLQRANDLLLQRDRELDAECRKFEGVAYEKEEKIKALGEESKWLKDAAYLCYEQGFDETLTQVKHFASGSLVDLSRVDREKKLEEILVKEASTDHNTQEAPAGMTV